MKGKYSKTKESVILEKGINVYLDHYNIKTEQITRVIDMWSVFHAVTHQLMYPDSHPSFTKGLIRIVPYNPDYTLYPNGINDEHIKTFLKEIFGVKR